jgi:hypothetical protein
LQGIALYEKVADSGLLTVSFPITLDNNICVQAGMTFGVSSSDDQDISSLSDSLINSIHLIPQSLKNILSGALNSYEQSNLNINCESDTINLELSREINNEEVLQSLTTEISEISKFNIDTQKADENLAAILKLCRNLSTAVHEQYELQYQFFIGNGSELGSFREIYVFQESERKEFDIAKTRIWSKLLKAHFSYFQQPNVGIFIEIEGRISPRVVEVIAIGKRIRSLNHIVENLGDESNNRHQTAINITKNGRQILVARSGAGKVWLYGNGKELLRWPNNDTRGWWVPEDTEPWNSEAELTKLIHNVNEKYKGNLTDEQSRLLIKSIHWVSLQPGLGCSLVICDQSDSKVINRLKERLTIPLNPRKLTWVKRISLYGAQQSHIQNTLIQDGATILDIQECEIEGQQLITPIDEDGKVYNPYRTLRDDGQSMTLEEIEARWSYGTRHTSACDLTKVLCGQCFTITVSADGPISVFYKGKLLDIDEGKKAFMSS